MDEFSCFNNHCVLNSSSMKAISTKTLWRLYLYTIRFFFFFSSTIWSPWNYFKNSRTYALSLSPLGTYKENGHYNIALKKELVQSEISVWFHICVYSIILPSYFFSVRRRPLWISMVLVAREWMCIFIALISVWKEFSRFLRIPKCLWV